jgi:hypothetical protein
VVVEARDFLELLPVAYVDDMSGLRQDVQAPQCLDHAIDVHDGKACGVSDIDL